MPDNNHMDFGVDLLPVTSATYFLGSSSKKWNIFVEQINGDTPVTLTGAQALTNKTYNGYTLAAASAKAVDTSISDTSSTNLPTTAAVVSYITNNTTDNKVLQAYKAYSGYTYWRPLLIGEGNSSSETGAFSDKTAGCYTFSNIRVQPSTGTLKATLFKGSGASLTNLDASNVSSGTLAVARGGTGTATASANTVFAGPTSGSATAPSFRALDASDIPSITLAKISDSGDAASYGVTDNSGNADVTSTDQNLITGRTLYYQLAKKGYTTNTGTVTSIATGVGLTGGTITTTGTIKANLTSDTKLNNAALTVTEDANRIYPIRIDKNDKLVVVVPWTNTNSNYLTTTGAAGDIIYWSSADTPTHLTKGSNGQFLKLVSGVPAWASITASDVSGLGTMATESSSSYIPKSAYTDGYQIMYSTGSGAYAVLTANKSTTKKFLSMTGASASAGAAPTWSTLDATDIPNLAWSKITSGKPTTLSGYGITDAATSGHIQAANKGGTGLQSYVIGDILYASGTAELSALSGNTTTTAKFLKSVGASNAATAPTWSTISKSDVGLGNVDNKSSATIRSEITSSNVTTALGFTPLNAALKGANNGVAELDSSGKIPASQLPAYVDDVLEYTSSDFPTTGETGIIYVNTTTNKTYRWSGTQMVEISASLALGTTSSTAFRGDYGQSAYTHAVTNKGSAFSSGLYKITTNAEGHVTAAIAVTAADIPSLSAYYKTVQTAKTDPTAHSTNTATAFIDTISQDTNGVITATKKNITSATISAKGIVQLSSSSSSSEEGMAATPKGVWAAINTLDATEVGEATKYIQSISETNGVITATAGSSTYGTLHNPVYINAGAFTQTSGNTVEFIRSTQTASTASWKGNTTDTALYDGKMIVYRLGYAGTSTGATLTLTFPDGTNSGAKNIYRYGSTTAITTHYAAGSMIFLIYDGVNGRWNSSAWYYSDSNSYVKQSSTTLENDWRGILTTYNSAADGTDITAGTTNIAYFAQSIRIQPATGKVKATEFVGSGASLTSLNGSNIASGTVSPLYGGTGLSSYTLGDILYASAENTLSALSGNTTTTVKFLKSVAATSGTAASPSWAQITASDISGLGTMATEAKTNYIEKSTLSGAYDLMYSSSANNPTRLAANTSTTKKFLTMTGTGSAGAAPGWNTISADDVPSLTMSKISDAGAAAKKGVTDNSSNADVTSSDTNLITGRTLYYQLAKKGYTTNTGTVTSVATGVGLTGGTITTSGTIKANLTSDTALTNAAQSVTESASRVYPVRIDKNSKLAVVVPWTDTNTLVNYSLAATTKAYLMASSNAPTSTKTAREAIGDTGVYLTATSGELSSLRYSWHDTSSTPVEKAYTVWNSTDLSIDFVFN